MAEVTGKFFGAGTKNNRNWVAVDTEEEGRVFLGYKDDLPFEIKKIRRGDVVTIEYDEAARNVTGLTVKEKEDSEEKYKRYRTYQIKLMQECIEDSAKIASAKKTKSDITIAITMFEKRCTPLAYFE